MIRKLTQEEYNNAADLSYQVCMECGRNDFTQEGIETFKSFVPAAWGDVETEQ